MELVPIGIIHSPYQKAMARRFLTSSPMCRSTTATQTNGAAGSTAAVPDAMSTSPMNAFSIRPTGRYFVVRISERSTTARLPSHCQK